MTSRGSLEFTRRGDAQWVVLAGEIDVHVVDTVTDAALDRLADSGPVTVDLGRVAFLDSVGLSLLLRLRQVAGTVRLVDTPPRVVRLFELTGVTNLFEFAEATADSLAAAG